MANREIYTHTPDGFEIDNKVLPDGTIAVRGDQLIVGDGETEASELEPIAGANYGSISSPVIASATIDISQSGTTELTWASGCNGYNTFPCGYIIEAANNTDTYTEDGTQDNYNVTFNGQTFANFALNKNFVSSGAPEYGVKRIVADFGTFSSLSGQFAAVNTGISTDVWSFIVGANAASTTQFRVTVKILGFKI